MNTTVTIAGSPCNACGSNQRPRISCSHCGGYGLVHGYGGDPTDCSSCGGSGHQWPPTCPSCGRFRSTKGWVWT